MVARLSGWGNAWGICRGVARAPLALPHHWRLQKLRPAPLPLLELMVKVDPALNLLSPPPTTKQPSHNSLPSLQAEAMVANRAPKAPASNYSLEHNLYMVNQEASTCPCPESTLHLHARWATAWGVVQCVCVCALSFCSDRQLRPVSRLLCPCPSPPNEHQTPRPGLSLVN